VVVPPHRSGAVGDAGVVDNSPLHPPEAVAVASHAENSELTAACDWQEATVVLEAQLKVTAGAGVTVNVRTQVDGDAQVLV
jgi:hypothetical protein